MAQLTTELESIADLLRAITKLAQRDAKRGDADAKLYLNHVFRTEDSTMQHNARIDPTDLVLLEMPDPLTGKPVTPATYPTVNRGRRPTPRPMAIPDDLQPLPMPGEELPQRTPPAHPATNAKWQRGFVANTQPTGWIGGE